MGRPLTSNPQAPVTVSTRPMTVVVLSRPPTGTLAQLIATVQVKLLVLLAAMENGDGNTQPRAVSVASLMVTLLSAALPALSVMVYVTL